MDSNAWDERYGEREFVWTTEANRFLVEHVSDLAPGRALDLATGEGRNAVWLAERGWEVTAVDFSPVGLGKARRLAALREVNVTWVLGDIVGYRPERHAFDLVTVLYLHLPVEQQQTVFRRAADAVGAGAHLLLVGHDRDNLTHGHGGPKDAAILWQPDEVVETIADANLQILEAGTVNRPVETDEGPATALDTLVLARRPQSSTA